VGSKLEMANVYFHENVDFLPECSEMCRFLDLALCAQRKNYSPCEPVQRARAVGGRLILDFGCHFRIVKFLGGNIIDLCK